MRQKTARLPATACRSPRLDFHAPRSRQSPPNRTRCAFSAETGRLALAHPKQWLPINMAAVFALVFLFVVVAGGLLAQVFTSTLDFGSIAAFITFMAMAWG